MEKIKIPYKPREVMKPFHARTERFACLVAHRRCGKTVAAVNDLIKTAITLKRERVRVAYIAPYYNQAKSIAWDYAKYYCQNIPNIKINESELRIDFPNGARLRLFGADNYDAMRGLYFDSVVLDEPADFPMNAWQTVIRPALTDRKGSATFIGTPKGKNEFWETYHLAKEDPSWYCAMHKASETGYVDEEELAESLKIMGEDRYDQEFECSFEAAISGAYYGSEMKAATKDGRITEVRYDKSRGVVTSWDLGLSDSTAIWFAQFMPNGDVHLIDYYENSGVGLDHYAQVLQEKGYVYEQHVLPHDVQVKELGTGKSRLETLDNLGVRPVEIAPKLRVDDGIQAVRSMLDRCWFDEKKCDRGVEMLRQYQRDFDEKMKTWRGRPRHDFTSHGADSFRYLATGHVRRAESWGEPIRRGMKGVA
jgi:hypothetical protein